VFYDFCRRIGVKYTDEQNAKLDLWIKQSLHCHWWFPYKGIVLASERHTSVEVDAQGRLHSLTGAAVAYRDGWGVHAVHGVRVPGWIIDKPQEITVDKIAAEQNAEIRRVMIEQYPGGQSKYLQDACAIEIHRDECGVLYRKELPGDEPLVMVKVLNSTPEADGQLTREAALKHFRGDTPVCHDGMMIRLDQAPLSLRFKNYFIRVAPKCRTAREAVAWTFDLTPEQYQPAMQS
jgi:hypothetical protein